MGRFLVFCSYLGTPYSGMQIQRRAGEVLKDVKTVQGVLERALQMLRPANEVRIKLSSRTDSSVHALCNSFQVDIVHRHPLQDFDLNEITSQLNYHLTKMNEYVRILRILRVNDDFNARYQASSRSYVYRLAIMKHISQSGILPYSALDYGRTYRIFPPFDTDKFLKAAELLSGTHDFLAFTTKQVFENNQFHPTVKNISIRVNRSHSYLEEYQHKTDDNMEYWDVHFESHSFLYKQVCYVGNAWVTLFKTENGGPHVETARNGHPDARASEDSRLYNVIKLNCFHLD